MKQHKSAQAYPNITVIPPLSDEWDLYGNRESVEASRKWAAENKIVLIGGVPPCAHGLYMMSCPVLGRCGGNSFDHVNMFAHVEDSSHPEIFLLSHPYEESPQANPATIAYANAHGLQIDACISECKPENPMLPSRGYWWYGAGTTPLVLSARSQSAAWPIEKELITALAMSPNSWPLSSDKREELYGRWTPVIESYLNKHSKAHKIDLALACGLFDRLHSYEHDSYSKQYDDIIKQICDDLGVHVK